MKRLFGKRKTPISAIIVDVLSREISKDNYIEVVCEVAGDYQLNIEETEAVRDCIKELV